MISNCCMAGPLALFQRRQALSAPDGLFQSSGVNQLSDFEVALASVTSDPHDRFTSFSTEDTTPRMMQNDELKLPKLLNDLPELSLRSEAAVKLACSPLAVGSPRLASSPMMANPAAYGCCKAPRIDMALIDDTRAHTGLAAQWMLDTLVVAGNYVGRQTHSALAQVQPHVEQLASQALHTVSDAMSTAVKSAGEHFVTLTTPQNEIWLDPRIQALKTSEVSHAGGALPTKDEEGSDGWAKLHAQLNRLDQQVRVQEQAVEEQVRGMEQRWNAEQNEKYLKSQLMSQETLYMPFKDLRQLPQMAKPDELGASRRPQELSTAGTNQCLHQQSSPLQSNSSQLQSHKSVAASQASCSADTSLPLSSSFDTGNTWQCQRLEAHTKPYVAIVPKTVSPRPESAPIMSTVCYPPSGADIPARHLDQTRVLQGAPHFVGAPLVAPSAPPRIMTTSVRMA